MSRLKVIKKVNKSIDIKNSCVALRYNTINTSRIPIKFCNYRSCLDCASYKDNLKALDKLKIEVKITYE